LEGEIRTTEGQSPKSPNLPKLLCLFDLIKSPRLLIGKDIFEQNCQKYFSRGPQDALLLFR